MKAIALAAITSLLVASTPISRDDIRDLQWHLDALSIPEAQSVSRGAGVVVGVIDTGVDGTHPDLDGSVLAGVDFVPGPSRQGQTDIDGHGTGIAGLIAAHGRATGIAPDAKILPVRAHKVPVSFTNDASDEINWAVDHGATVLCLAFTEAGTASQPEAEAIARAIAKDVVVVAGIGNTTGVAGVYPAAHPGVVAVAGTDRAGNHAAVSVTGPQAVLAAPAVDITTTAPISRYPSGYLTADGTSAATAIVAGVAALVRAKYPNLSASEVIHRMTATADDKGPPGRDVEYGYGIVNPVRALTADLPPLTSPSPNANPEPPPTGGPSRWWWLLIPIAAVALIAAGFLVRARRQ